jgi:asparagine synthase (glutamine-hydrolysing)
MRGADTLARAQLPLASEELARREWDVVLGHRRLSIIDLSEAGHQPMGSASGRSWIAYNGEIYNYLEIRAELEALGQRFSTRTDTEVLLAAYESWGQGMLDRLEGMFAFALLDCSRGELFLARDPFGIKPLYQAETGDYVAFASQMDCLRQLPGVTGRADGSVAANYLWLGERTAGERTFFESIRTLQAAHCQSVRVDGARSGAQRRYWSCRQAQPLDVDFDEAVSRVREALFDSVRIHMRSDVPLGSCLSGGLDSSAIVAAMRGMSAPERPVHTFSFVSEDASQSEEPYIDMVEGVMRHKVRPVADDVLQDLDRLLDAQEVPFGTLSIYAQFKVFELASQARVKVMLDGQGADEIFGGYDTIVLARAASLVARGRIGDAWSVLTGLPAAGASARLRNALVVVARLATAHGLSEPLAALRRSTGVPPWVARDYLGSHRDLHAAGPGAQLSVRNELHDYIEQTTLPQLLRYEDLNSMYFSIESRVPYCNRRLVDLVFGLPDRYLVSDTGRTKSVLRSAVVDIVPEAILTRRKVGFVAPDATWLRAGFDTLMARCHKSADACPPFIDLAVFEEWARRQLERRMPAGSLWRGLNLVLWSSARGVSW